MEACSCSVVRKDRHTASSKLSSESARSKVRMMVLRSRPQQAPPERLFTPLMRIFASAAAQVYKVWKVTAGNTNWRISKMVVPSFTASAPKLINSEAWDPQMCTPSTLPSSLSKMSFKNPASPLTMPRTVFP